MQNEQKTTGTPRKSDPELSPKEKELVELLEHLEGRKLSPEQVHHALKQAREVGEL